MPTRTSSPEAITLTYDAANDLLLGNWPARVADTTLRADYSQLIAAAQAHGGCRFWLLDVRGRNWHSPTFGQWFGADFAVAAHAALRQPLFIAYVLDPAHRVIADQPGVQATQRGCSKYDVYPYLFDGPAAAREWLAHQQSLRC